MEDLDVLQFPTYDQYFAAREQIPALAEAPVTLLFESSRGCWWGAKSQCTFCGLNGHAIGYRSKSPVRLLAELHALVERWPCQSIEAVDNILDMNYFETVFPELEKMSLPGPSFFEVKANLRRRHVAQLARAGITRIQPGIESLSDHVLELMRKGTTGLRNVQLLKWCREYGVAVDWNLLYGFPGERDVDYEGMLLVLPAIRHLQQPGACGPIRLDRFSPYFEAPAKHGLINVRAMHVYRFIYPLPEIRLNEIAYYFDYDYEQSVAPSSRALETAELAHRLRTEPCAGSLRALPTSDGGMHIYDDRDGAPKVMRLSQFERRIVEAIDEVRSAAAVLHLLERTFPGSRFELLAVTRFLDELVERQMALHDGDRYLGLVLMPASMRAALEHENGRSSPVRRHKLPVLNRTTVEQSL